MGGNNASLLEDIRTTKKSLTQTAEGIISGHTTFTSQFNAFLSLSEQLEIKFKELEVREAAVEIRENEVKENRKRLEDREKNCVEREQKAEVLAREVTVKEAKWREMEDKGKENAAKLPNVIHFNVSGTKFAIEKEKLLQHKGSLFEHLISTSQLPSTNEVFISRDPTYFLVVFRFLLNGKYVAPSNGNECVEIEQEFAYFGIPFPSQEKQVVPSTKEEKDDLPADYNEDNKIREWFPGKKFTRLYKASVDGFGAADFHRLCDNKGPTLTVIRSSNNYLFGGYAPLPWDTSNTYKSHKDAFIFTLTNPHNIPPTKYIKNHDQYAFCGSSTFGPVFGGGNDIVIRNNSHQTNTNSTTFYSYTDTTGKGSNTFTGSCNFTAKEIEVFSVL